jgi:DNA-binding IclR family transcriptional regulator
VTNLIKDNHWTAIYRVRHDGHEIGQTEQAKGSADVTAQLWDRRTHTNEAIGVFASHKEAEKAIVKEWQRRHAG